MLKEKMGIVIKKIRQVWGGNHEFISCLGM